MKKSIIIIASIVIIIALALTYTALYKSKQGEPAQNQVTGNDENDKNTAPVSNDITKKSTRKILFAHLNGSSSIWIVNEDGSGLKEIVSENIANANSATLSPKQDKIAYNSIEEIEKTGLNTSRTKTSGIRIIDLTTNKSTLIISRENENTGIGFPKFSPSGEQLAYLIKENEESDIYITDLLNLMTEKIITLTSLYRVSAGEMEIQWLPDSKKIVYLHDNDIYVADLNGNIQKIISGGKPEKREDLAGNKWDVFTIGNLAITSDGKRIEYTKDSGRFTVDIDGNNNISLEQPLVFKGDEDKYINVVGILPNSNKALVLESWPKGQDPYMQKLLVYNIDSKESEVLYEGDKYYYPNISPDGKFIAVSVSNNKEEGIYFMDLAGKNVKKITSISYYEILEWR